LHLGDTRVETFRYTARDLDGGEASATVTVTVHGQNDAPTANDDVAALREDSAPFDIDVLANDTDPDAGAALSVLSVTTGTAGSTIQGLGTHVRFTPAAAWQALAKDEVAVETFEYTAVDDNGAESEATVTVTLTGDNDAPVAG